MVDPHTPTLCFGHLWILFLVCQTWLEKNSLWRKKIDKVPILEIGGNLNGIKLITSYNLIRYPQHQAFQKRCIVEHLNKTIMVRKMSVLCIHLREALLNGHAEKKLSCQRRHSADMQHFHTCENEPLCGPWISSINWSFLENHIKGWICYYGMFTYSHHGWSKILDTASFELSNIGWLIQRKREENLISC